MDRALGVVADDDFGVVGSLGRPGNVLRVHGVTVARMVVTLALRVLLVIDAELGDLIGVSAGGCLRHRRQKRCVCCGDH